MPMLRHIATAAFDPKATASSTVGVRLRAVGETSPTSPLAQGYFLSDGTLNIAILKFKTDQIGKGMDYTGVHTSASWSTIPRSTPSNWSRSARCFMGKEKGHGKGFFEIKFKARTAPCSTSPAIRGWGRSRWTRRPPA